MVPSFVLNICNLGWHCFEMNPLYQTCIISNHSSCLLPDGQVFCSMANIWLPVNNAVNDIRIYSDSWRCLCLAKHRAIHKCSNIYIQYLYTYIITMFTICLFVIACGTQFWCSERHKPLKARTSPAGSRKHLQTWDTEAPIHFIFK